jgi:hypothetical protein
MKIIIKIKTFELATGADLLKLLKKKKIIFSPWIENILNKKKFNTKNFLPIELVIINLKKDLGINKAIYLKDIYKILKNKKLKLLRPEIALYAATRIKIKKKGTWHRFATPLNSMIDSDGIPHLPKIGRALNSYFVETYWAYPKAVFHPHNSFIVCK